VHVVGDELTQADEGPDTQQHADPGRVTPTGTVRYASNAYTATILPHSQMQLSKSAGSGFKSLTAHQD